MLTSRVFFPKHNHCPRTRVKCGAEKWNWAAGQALTPIGLERVFQRNTQAVDSPGGRKDVKIVTEGVLK